MSTFALVSEIWGTPDGALLQKSHMITALRVFPHAFTAQRTLD